MKCVIHFLAIFLALVVLATVRNISANALPLDATFASAALHTLAGALLFAAPMLFWGQATLWLYIPLFVWIWLTVNVETFIRLTFQDELNRISYEWLLVLMNSSFHEVMEFMSLFVTWKMLLALLLSIDALFGFCFCLIKYRTPRTRLSIALGVVCLLPFLWFNIPCPCTDDLVTSLLFDSRVVDDVKMGLSNYAELSAAGANDDFAVRPRSNVAADSVAAVGAPAVTLVIGESSTSSRWGIYGYEKNTTPNLSAIADELLLFRDMEAAAKTTTQALRLLLTDAERDSDKGARHSLPAICRAAGHATMLISTQGHWGQFDGADTLLFSACDEKRFLADSHGNGYVLDGEIVPVFKQALSARTRPLTLFVHTMGSHFDYRLRLPDGYEKTHGFQSGSRDDLYDATILYTDEVLSTLIDALRADGKPNALIYISDHGESFTNVPRDPDSPDMWRIPMFIWFSPEYRRLYPEIVAECSAWIDQHSLSDALLPLLIRLALVDWKLE